MSKYKDNLGNFFKVDDGGNIFINGKCNNPKSWEALEIAEGKYAFDSGWASGILEEYEEKVVATGHVPNFSYGHGDEVVHVQTGHEAW